MGAKQICFIFLPPPICACSKLHGDVIGQPHPAEDSQDPGDSAALGMGWDTVEYNRKAVVRWFQSVLADKSRNIS